MKLFKSLLFIVGILVSVNLSAQSGGVGSTSMCTVRVHNPECCPPCGSLYANHPILGAANGVGWTGNGIINVNICWDTFLPGAHSTHFYAQTITVAAGNNVDYDYYYCYGEADHVIGYGVSLDLDLYMEFRTIIDPAITD